MTLTIFILRLAVSVLLLPLFLLNFLGLWTWICKKWFPYFLVSFSETYNKQMASKKRELFSNLLDYAGPSGKLSLLELGCGTGTNFRFYPPGCRVTCVDPNPNFEKFLIKSIAENRHLQFERFMVASGENMHLLPDGSMDAVVCTLVLCSVESQEQTLQEVCRVLRPRPLRRSSGRDRRSAPTGGRRRARNCPNWPIRGGGAFLAFAALLGGAFYFMEHVAAERSTWNYFWQQVLCPAWYLLFDGCNLTRESWKAVEKAGFSRLQLQHLQAPLTWELVRPHIYGYAVK
ncbi:putative methyltransferase-like protein 7A isoform X1 [Artibeus jamaicensis]|uniref:putative methyltransferase-like protein 7A isoform X1 n=1 Tax=Artibeus jamaicensis TaxID=9417 RepID=UPI00235A8CA0|nr:putative methyltransferase-like protein 7A isoform X1 [Artibeus jamaicensis]